MPEPRVRELARDALVELAPVSVRGVEEDWRGQLADYVLGQQSGPEATATKGHLRRSEAARTWARSLLDSLEQLYANGSVPAIPEGERGSAAPAAQPRPPAAAAAWPRPPRGRRARRARARDGRPGHAPAHPGRRGRGGRAAARPARLAGRPAHGRRRRRRAAAPTTASPRPRPATRASRPRQGSRPASRSWSTRAASGSCSCRRRRFRPAARTQGYEVWLYNSRTTRSRSAARSPTSRATTRPSAPSPTDFEKYKFIDVSRSRSARTRSTRASRSCAGRCRSCATRRARRKKPAALGQTVLKPPG